MIDLIYTSGDNRHYAQLTVDAQWLIGVRSDKKAYREYEIAFVDVQYKSPNYERHMRAVKELKPHYATVPDLSERAIDRRDILRALRQADQLATFCKIVLVVPKLTGQLAFIPKDFAIGFSVPTAYGGAQMALWEVEVQKGLEDRRIHLLGGSPHIQMDYYLHVSSIAQVISADGNMFQYMSRFQKYWSAGVWVLHPHAKSRDKTVTHQCVEWSLNNVRKAWLEINPGNIRR